MGRARPRLGHCVPVRGVGHPGLSVSPRGVCGGAGGRGVVPQNSTRLRKVPGTPASSASASSECAASMSITT